MSFRCPGYLNAKSLSEGGDCREDYVEWFSNPVLSPYRPLIDAVYKAMQYRGDDPVLLVCGVSSEACLLFRFTMKSQDRKGRNHQRCEVMKVDQSELPTLLNGEFNAVPDEDNKEFVVDGVEGTPLPQRERHQVKDAMLDVYARNSQAYWFKNEETVRIIPPRQQSTDDSRRNIRSKIAVEYPRKGKSIMSKMLFTLLVGVCVFGGWNYFQSADEIERLREDLKLRNNEVSCLRRKNSELQVKINEFGKWVRTRSNFELNKVQLKTKFGEIINNFKEVESLLTHIDEPPKSSFQARKSVVHSYPPDVTSGTNNVSVSAGKSLLRHDGDKKVGTVTEPSRREELKHEDKKKDKSWFEAPVEKVKNLF